ncbi:thioesterase II family protein [Kutzneria sp. NPDC052558]|uniref:thioesterase II family protein n=1 Tax=Kutzneria sp. NPDC052558 TaxID=3364121 RepID=UPI0037C76743
MTNYRWLVRISGDETYRHVLYAIPHAGAGAAAVKKTCHALAERCATVAVRLPGRESRMDEEPITDLDVLADELAEQIAGHAGGRRIFLYGHCSGAVVAYEVARRLPAERLGHLVVSAHQAPDRIPAIGAWRLPRDPFLARVAADGYLPAEILDEPQLVELVEPALRADYQAVECHRSSMEVLGTPILALLGTEEHSVDVADVRAWSALTSVGFRLRFLPGGHNLLLEGHTEVADALAAVIG